MSDLVKPGRPAWGAVTDSRATCGRVLAQRALACELTGKLDCAVALIRRLQRPGTDATVLAARTPGPV
jgi:hypothetical protein